MVAKVVFFTWYRWDQNSCELWKNGIRYSVGYFYNQEMGPNSLKKLANSPRPTKLPVNRGEKWSPKVTCQMDSK